MSESPDKTFAPRNRERIHAEDDPRLLDPRGLIKDWAHPALESIIAAAAPTESVRDRTPAHRAEDPNAQYAGEGNDEQASASAKERIDRTP